MRCYGADRSGDLVVFASSFAWLGLGIVRLKWLSSGFHGVFFGKNVYDVGFASSYIRSSLVLERGSGVSCVGHQFGA